MNELPCGAPLWETACVGANKLVWEHWLERLYNLRRDKRGSHERPHKPLLLLSIIDMIDRGLIKANAVPLTDELVKVFKSYFAVVREGNDQPTIQNPYFHLSGDGFWQLVPTRDREPIYRTGAVSGAPSVAELRRSVAYGKFDEGLWTLMSDQVGCHQLREALIARYFPERREEIAAVAVQNGATNPSPKCEEEPPPGRDAAFRKTILEIYDYRCAACGLRVLLDQTMSLVEAAHLIPFAVSRNDKPTNGMALCPNHHWAMDKHLIAPCPDAEQKAGVWRINEKRLDARIEGQRELRKLANCSVIPPSEMKFFPAADCLRWRETNLTRQEA